MRARRLLFAVAFAALGAVACNAITGLGDDFRLAPGGGDGAPGDGAESSDGAAGDASAGDGGLVDGSGDGSTTRLDCDAANVVFCTDFEADASWNGSEAVSGAVTFEPTVGKGSSRGMHAHIDSAAVSRRATLWKRIAGADAKTFARYEIEFDFRVSSNDVDYSAIGILALTQSGGGLPYYGLAAYADNGNQTFEVIDDSPRITGDGEGVEDATGAWHHAKMTYVKNGAGTYDVEIRVDGTVVDQRGGFDFGTPQTAELRIGILFTTSDDGTMDLYVDDIVIRRGN